MQALAPGLCSENLRRCALWRVLAAAAQTVAQHSARPS